MITRSARPPKPPPLQPWPSRSHVTVFLKCLHLLDLDLLEDWPDVTESLFAAKTAQQTLQQRVKAVEWSLYRLFEIYDAEETQDKLRPFFPPAAPLQSLNLRAALYRCLTELKKNGVLGKDVLLRKTMLDDCKGDRFEEMMANFAITVLRKSTGSSLIQTKARTDSQLLPLILAYRQSLQTSLQTRTGIHVQVKQEQQRLEEAESRLTNRLENVHSVSVETDRGKQKELRAQVNSSWVGNDAWIEILLRGAPFHGELEDAGSAGVDPAADASRNLLKNLDDRISEHQSRLNEWRVIAKDLRAKQDLERQMTEVKTAPTPEDTPIQFLQHKKLNLEEWKQNPPQELPMDESYSRLLDAMKQELATAGKRKGLPSSKQRMSSRTTQSTIQQAEAVKDPGPASTHTLYSAGLRLSYGSTGTDQETDESIGAEDTLLVSSSPVSIQSPMEDSPSMPVQPSNVTEAQLTPRDPRLMSPNLTDEPPNSPSNMWMNLAERTRASIALTGRQSILPDPDPPVTQPRKSTNIRESITPDLQLSDDEEQRTTLLERTRKSMLQFSANNMASASRSKRRSEYKRTSQIYPVNQFETPRQPHAQNLDIRSGDTGTGSGSSTPREKLFDEDAEYASVFKSRPKIALSPAFSPRRGSGLGLESVLEDSMQELDLDSD